MTRDVVLIVLMLFVAAVAIVLVVMAVAGRKPKADGVEQTYEQNGFLFAPPEAPADDELPEVDVDDVNTLVSEIYRAQTRHRFPSIYGEDQS